MRPHVPAYNPDGTPYFDEEGPTGGASFIGVDTYNEQYNENTKLFGNLYVDVEIIKGLSYKMNLGGDYNYVNESSWDDPRNPGNTAEGKGRATRNYTSIFTYTLTNTLNYEKTIATDHNINVLLAHEAQQLFYEATDVATLNFPHPKLQELGAGAENEDAWGTSRDYALLSYFGRLNYDYANRYYFEGSLRRDGSSRFGDNYRFATFYSVGVNWRLSSESFMQDLTFIHNAKVRATYGTTGNQGAESYYAYQGLVGYGYDYNGQPGSALEQIQNPDLKWEQTSSFNLGLDLGLFNRINASVEYYQKKTTDLLQLLPITRTTGLNSRYENIGSMANKGIEASINADVVRTEFVWNVDFKISHNKNEILELYQEIVDGTKIRREGEAYETFYMAKWAGVNPATGHAMWYDEDGNLVESYTSADKEIVGIADPKFYGSFTNGFEYKGISLTAMLYYQYGNKIYNSVSRITESDGAFAGFNQDDKQLDRWQQPGDYTTNPQRVSGNATSSNQMSTRWLEDGSYLRLRDVTLAYTLPSEIVKKAYLTNLRIYVQGTNLWTKTNFTGIDPEQTLNGTTWFVHPNTKTYTVGINVGF